MWELDYKDSWVPKNWCFWTVVLEKTPESPLDWKEIQPVHPKGSQSWIVIGSTDAEAETLVLWPPNVKNWLVGKDPNSGEDWRWEEKGTTEDEMVGWHHQFNGHEFEEALELVMDREVWRTAVHGSAKVGHNSDWTELLLSKEHRPFSEASSEWYRRWNNSPAQVWLFSVGLCFI